MLSVIFKDETISIPPGNPLGVDGRVPPCKIESVIFNLNFRRQAALIFLKPAIFGG